VSVSTLKNLMSWKPSVVLIVASAVMVAGSGCATMFTGTSQQVTVSSQPSGARVFVNGNYYGVTPVALMLKTRRDYNIILQRDGFQDTTASVARRFNPVALLNVFSLLCWVVDGFSGALWRLDRGGIYVTLLPLPFPAYQLPPAGEAWPMSPALEVDPLLPPENGEDPPPPPPMQPPPPFAPPAPPAGAP
jgi:hypothetical protein